MAKLFKSNERGAVSGYAIGAVILVVLLIGGILLLKNINGSKPATDKPLTVDTGEFKDDDDEKDKDDSVVKTTTITPEDTTKTDPTTEHTPDELTATGPEDFVIAIIGLALASATIYALREYARSRSAVKSALLRQ
ncbi:hypothetical protein FWH58_01965 [Candidatus Saccharibacteria bacterium]|nr:hypothetical protein [Candidatus Saccharibacteria bacterium]